jgi:hypothetical protein
MAATEMSSDPLDKHKSIVRRTIDTNDKVESTTAAIASDMQASALVCGPATPAIRQIRALPPVM